MYKSQPTQLQLFMKAKIWNDFDHLFISQNIGYGQL